MRATRQLARFLTLDGTVPDPPAVTRPVFLDYLAWTRRSDTAADARLANTGAYLLESLHDTGLVADLGSAMFLRRGENVHHKARSPRPFPPDVIERIDTLIVDNPATDPTLRAMIATTRWAGCRISELVALPLDCLHHSDGGHWIEYWMTKTNAWRRFPIPDSLATIILNSRPASATPTGLRPRTCSPEHDPAPPPAAPNPGPPAVYGTASQRCSANTESPPRRSPVSRFPAETSTASVTPSE